MPFIKDGQEVRDKKSLLDELFKKKMNVGKKLEPVEDDLELPEDDLLEELPIEEEEEKPSREKLIASLFSKRATR